MKALLIFFFNPHTNNFFFVYGGQSDKIIKTSWQQWF